MRYGFYGRNFEDFAAVEENERLNKTFGIVAHTELLLPNQSSISISLQERVISKSKPGVYYMYLWTQYRGHCYPDQLLARITVKDTGITVDPATSINACNDERHVRHEKHVRKNGRNAKPECLRRQNGKTRY